MKIKGKVIIKDNKADLFADDLYIEKDRRLTVTGALTGSEIYVDMETGTGTLTNDYSKYNSVDLVTIEPSKYFVSAKGYDVVLKDGQVEISSGWATLKKQIEEYTGTDPIKLTKDYAAKTSDDRIKIPAGKEITIDLNGHTLNRNRAAKTSDGHVIEVFGTLLLTDTSTTKTGALTGCRSAHGGAIAAYAEMTLKGCTVSGNTAHTTGGGIWSSKSLTLENSVLDNNTANGISDSRGGGAIAAYAEATLDGCTLSFNKTHTSGGGIWTKTALTMTDCNVNNNIAENNSGGGIYALSYLNLDGCYVSENTCAEWGGGIYLPDNSGSTLKYDRRQDRIQHMRH